MSEATGTDPSGLTFLTVDDVTRYGSSRFFTFIDTHPDYAGGDGAFQVLLSTNLFPGPILGSLPSARHNHASPVAFADGHLEMHRWVDPRTFKVPDGDQTYIVCVPPSKDQQWLEIHATERVKNF